MNLKNLDEAKIILIEAVINSLDNGFIDENVQRELRACISIAKTIKQPFEKHLLLKQLDEMVSERVNG